MLYTDVIALAGIDAVFTLRIVASSINANLDASKRTGAACVRAVIAEAITLPQPGDCRDHRPTEGICILSLDHLSAGLARHFLDGDVLKYGQQDVHHVRMGPSFHPDAVDRRLGLQRLANHPAFGRITLQCVFVI